MSQEAKILTGIGILTLIVVVAAAFFFGGNSSSSKPQTLSANQARLVVRSTSHQTGPKNAKVTLVEFGDFECPACGAAYPIVTQLLQNYKGKINYVFREYPLPIHQNADLAANAAEAAGAQGKFFEMYNLLYSNQNTWGESNNAMDYFVKYAQELHLDVNKFKNDVQSKKYESVIQKDIADGNALGVQATPTFYINNQVQVGGLSYDDFSAKIQQALKTAR